jgi:hypothetical protein
MTDQIQPIAPTTDDHVDDVFVEIDRGDANWNPELNTGRERQGTRSVPARAERSTPANGLGDLAHEIENLTKAKALGLVAPLRDKISQTFFGLGGVLSVIQRNKWFRPHESFRKFVLGMGLNYRPALYYVEIYEKITQLELPDDLFEGLGWTKMRTLTRILTKDNAEHWVKLARETSNPELKKRVDAAIAAANPQSAPSPKPTFTRIKFDDRQMETIGLAIARSREQSGIEDESAALESVCSAYLKRPTLVEALSYLTARQLGRLLGTVFARFDEVAVTDALKVACAGRPSITVGEAGAAEK